MEQPTKEEVETWKYESAHSPLHDHAFENHNRLICIADAYLALREDREKLDEYIVGLVREKVDLQAENQGLERCVVEKINRIGTLAGKIQQLEADNEALRARLGNNILEA